MKRAVSLLVEFKIRLKAVLRMLLPGRLSRSMSRTVTEATGVINGLITSNFWPDYGPSYSEAFSGVDREIRVKFFATMRFRAYLTSWLAEIAIQVPGAFVEIGTSWGILAKHYILDRQIKREVYLFDLWGFDPAELPDLPTGNGDYTKDIFNSVRNRFVGDENVVLVRGLIPDSLSALPRGLQIAYLSIDLNSWEAEINTLEKLWDQISCGGVIYFDDYGESSYQKLRSAVDSFMRSHGQTLLALPSGQAFVLKKCD